MSDRYMNDQACGIEPEHEGEEPTFEQWRGQCRKLWADRERLCAALSIARQWMPDRPLVQSAWQDVAAVNAALGLPEPSTEALQLSKVEWAKHEEGPYRNFCEKCGNSFFGMKRAILCDTCKSPANEH